MERLKKGNQNLEEASKPKGNKNSSLDCFPKLGLLRKKTARFK